MFELIRFAWSCIRGDWKRSLATCVTVLIAVTSFAVLTSSVQTQRLEVTQTAEVNFRNVYDVLVRPAGSLTSLERTDALVRSSYLSGIHGGISLAQLEQIKGMGGVEIAAPTATIGIAMQYMKASFDVTEMVGSDRRSLLRYQLTASSRAGHVTSPSGHGFVYATNAPFVDGVQKHEGGTLRSSGAELIDGVTRFPCMGERYELEKNLPFTELLDPFWAECGSLATPERSARTYRDGRFFIDLAVSYPMLVMAIDPDAEAALVGLDAATVTGRSLSSADGWLPATYERPSTPPSAAGDAGQPTGHPPAVPALIAATQSSDYTLQLAVQEMDPALAEQFARLPLTDSGRTLIEAATPIRATTKTLTMSEVYSDHLAANPPNEDLGATFDWGAARSYFSSGDVLQPGEVTLSQGTPMAALAVPNDAESWLRHSWTRLPRTALDTGFRPVELRTTDVVGCSSGADPNSCYPFVRLNPVGSFDPEKLRAFSHLSQLPLETYRSAELMAADDATEAALGAKTMVTDLNPAGYVQAPPAMLVSLKSLDAFAAGRTSPLAIHPISAVRVRVAGVTGMDAVSRERIRLVADQIQTATGLAVDITAGASLSPQSIALPATKLGVPPLNLRELWSKKGVALAIVAAIDGKSLLLFSLILLSSAMTVAISANAAVSARRGQIAVLACVGWRPGLARQAVLLELGLLGAAAGVAGALASWGLTSALGIDFTWQQALVAIPAAVGLTVLAGLASAVAAARTSPLNALRPPVRAARGAGLPVNGPVSLGLNQLGRRPGRLLLGALAVALPVAAGTLLGSIVFAFQGAIVGSLLGDAVALQARTADVIAAGFLALLGLAAVALTTFVSVQEDAHSYAALSAMGWRDGLLGAAVLAQATGVGLAGALLGAATGLALLVLLTGGVTGPVLGVATVSALAAVLLSAVAALAPAAALRRFAAARILADE